MTSRSGAGEECLDPLLPHVAGVIENMDVATFQDIKSQVEADLEREISDSDLIKALEAGVKLGMFNMKREFKVCREFTTKEIKKLKHMKANMGSKSCKKFKGNKNQRTLLEYVRKEREQRKKKLHRRRRRREVDGSAHYHDDFNDSLCRKCKQNSQRDRSSKGKSLRKPLKPSLREGGLSGINEGSDTSTDSNGTNYEPDKDDRSEDDDAPKKSKLLIQKNSMETKPPYCDIFT